MIDGLKLHVPGRTLQERLGALIRECESQIAADAERLRSAYSADAPRIQEERRITLLRAERLRFYRDHLLPDETYALSPSDLEILEMSPRSYDDF